MTEYYKKRHARIIFLLMIIASPFLFISDDASEELKPKHCTVLYATDGTSMLGGNNEDWSDPNTMFWFIPPSDEKFGWIKFGFSGGYPQGGMNEHGLYWDATGSPYLAMPFSEAHKEKFNGSLMGKVMEECKTVPEALSIFKKLYCEDQYKSQYLVGDASGRSAIIEGDSVIPNDGGCQVLTNFYQSAPELGGYPCWRYLKASTMLQSGEELSLELIGSILEATHQEGAYPTQYSNIYDLKNKNVYLFHNHNFDEFISIDLGAELKNSAGYHHIADIYSGIKIISPDYNAEVDPSSVIFQWQGKSGRKYEIRYSTDPSFDKYNSIALSNSGKDEKSIFYFCLLAAFGLIITGPRIHHAVRKTAVILFFLAVSGCADIVEPGQSTGIKVFNATAENLEENSTYYWKVIVTGPDELHFKGESIVYKFNTNPEL